MWSLKLWSHSFLEMGGPLFPDSIFVGAYPYGQHLVTSCMIIPFTQKCFSVTSSDWQEELFDSYVSGVISHHPLTHASVQPDICLFPPPCFCSCSLVTSAMPTEPHPYVC